MSIGMNPTSKEYLINSFTVDSGYNFPLHTHESQWEMVYCENGSFDHFVNGTKYRQEEGEMIFIREFDSHLLNGKNFKYHNIAFSSAWMNLLGDFLGEDLIKRTIIENKNPPYFKIPQKDRIILQNRISSLRNRSQGIYEQVEFSHFLIYVIDSFMIQKEETSGSENMPQWFLDTIRMINDTSGEIPSLEEVIDRSGRCAEHVSRSFRKYLQLTPSQYLKGVKLKKAGELLRYTNYSIKEISYLSSYESLNYFHKQFRELYGKTPSEYRKLNNQYIH
jgi:AraC family cel operon transcriptional repressor